MVSADQQGMVGFVEGGATTGMMSSGGGWRCWRAAGRSRGGRSRRGVMGCAAATRWGGGEVVMATARRGVTIRWFLRRAAMGAMMGGGSGEIGDGVVFVIAPLSVDARRR